MVVPSGMLFLVREVPVNPDVPERRAGWQRRPAALEPACPAPSTPGCLRSEFGYQFRIRVSLSKSGVSSEFGYNLRIRVSLSSSGISSEFGHQFRTRVSVPNLGISFKLVYQFQLRVSVANSSISFKFGNQFRIRVSCVPNSGIRLHDVGGGGQCATADR